MRDRYVGFRKTGENMKYEIETLELGAINLTRDMFRFGEKH